MMLLSLLFFAPALGHRVGKGYGEKMLSHVRNDWRKGARCQPGESHELMFGVQQRNIENGRLESVLGAVSNPASLKATETRHLSFEEVGALTANSEATASIQTYLEAHGAIVTRATPRGEYIRARANVSSWEAMLPETEFYHYDFVDTKGQVAPSRRNIIRTESYLIPAGLSKHVSFIFFATQLPPRKPESMMPKKITDPKRIEELRRQVLNGSSSGPVKATGDTTPDLLNSFYSISTNEGSKSVSQALFESLGQYYSPSDLSTFQNYFKLPSEKVSKDVGGHASDTACSSNPNNCAEANLDVQYMMAVSQVTPTTFWYIDNEDTPFLSFIEAVASDSNPPLVNSMSYGSIEGEVEESVLSSFSTEAMKLGTMGVTIFVSSGDDGVANFQARSDPSACGFNPSFPATCPYVTAVGATQGPEEGSEEIACQSNKGGSITTGGGFSTYYAAPSYQTSAVSDYFAAAKAPEGTGFDKGNRGYPDVAMLGHNYLVAIAGNMYQVSGTSCASPVVAGIFSLINAQRMANGKGPVGFINPTLYSAKGSTCNDITSGENDCCAGSPGSEVCCSEGFYAAKGWDPLTGWGSVDYSLSSSHFL